MSFIKRIFLFLLTNLLVILTISITLSLLNVRPYLNAAGIDYGALLVFSLVWGMGGAFISLALSRVMAKAFMGVRVIEQNSAAAPERELVQLTHSLAHRVGLSVMPEVGVYESPELNAFATGPTKSRALVAVSSGMLARLNKDELTGVIGHELAHVQNGDMVTMTLLQGIINAFVIFFARAIAWAVVQRLERDSRGLYIIIQLVLEIVLSLLGWILVAAFSRRREFRADAGSAKTAGREKMIAALEALKKTRLLPVPTAEPASLATLKISGTPARFTALFSTHPSLDERIARLRQI